MLFKQRDRNILLALITFVFLLIALFQNPYYNPPIPESITSASNKASTLFGSWFGNQSIEDAVELDQEYPAHSYDDVNEGLKDLQALNDKMLKNLMDCMAEGSCGQNQTKVVILTGYWVLDTMVLGGRGGEGVWVLSIVKALRQMGYSFFLASSYMDAVTLYREVPELVNVVAGFEVSQCSDDAECVKSESNPTGIPRWKRDFDMAFYPWGGNDGGLGWQWVLHAERPGPSNPEHNNFHWMGYSLEDQCDHWKKLANDVKSAPNSAWFYSKQLTYAYSPFSEFAWNRSYFAMATDDLKADGLTFRGAYKNDPTFLPERIEGGVEMVPLDGIDNLGKIGPEDFARELARSKLLVGIGQPWFGPSPWLGLCLRTPFLNPLKSWNVDDPDDRSRWSTQHDALAGLEPPYVYHVKAGDYNDFLAAIKDAVANPMSERYLDPEMTERAMRYRVSNLVEEDWESLARKRAEQLESEGRSLGWTL